MLLRGLSLVSSGVAVRHLTLRKAPWWDTAGGAASGLPVPRPGGAAARNGAAAVPGAARALRELPWGRQRPRVGGSSGPCRGRSGGGPGAVGQRRRHCCRFPQRGPLRFREAGFGSCRSGHRSFAEPATLKHRRGVLMSFAPPEQRLGRRAGAAARRGRASRAAQQDQRTVSPRFVRGVQIPGDGWKPFNSCCGRLCNFSSHLRL